MTGPVKIRILGPGDEAVLTRVASDVFDDEVVPELSAEFLRDQRHHIVVALQKELVIGFASGVYVHPDNPPELWINEVGVAPSHQRRGVGRQVLRTMLGLGAELGCRAAWVLTSRSNLPAMGLYASVGGDPPEEAVMFTFQLDPGGRPMLGSEGDEHGCAD
jgi:ribosomal protein S18 acetylase RimI-like enzyme